MAPELPATEFAPGWFSCPWPAEDARPVAFAQQVLPAATLHAAESVRAAAAAAAAEIVARTPPGIPWRLEIVRAWDCPAVRPGRAKLLEGAVVERLRKIQRSLLRHRVAELPAAGTRVQLGMAGTGMLAVSVTDAGQRAALRTVLSPLPGGVAEIPEDRRPPSRAYRKLLEAEAQFERTIQPGETCVDLGGSPGGWTHVALGRGAQVALVDRAAPRADVLGHRNLTFVQGDAFRHVPPAPVDWLLCDVIAFPARTLELLEAWLAAKRCRHFVATFKFRGDEDYPVLDAAKTVLARWARDGRLRRLLANKNEAMAFGSV